MDEETMPVKLNILGTVIPALQLLSDIEFHPNF